MTSTTINFPDFLSQWNEMQNQTTPDVHLQLALWLEQKWEEGDKRLLVMAFRSCGKSTIVGVFCVWLLWRNPDLRILVLAADMALACKMVRNVKRIIEKHPLTQHLKPASRDQWGSDRFTLSRSKELRDPTMLAKGIMTNLTGTRADLIICDDVEVPKTSDTSGKRENLRELLVELDFILTPEGTQIYVGTPHHWETIYADDKRPGADEIFLTGFERIVIPVMDKEGKSAWPERFSEKKLEQMMLKTGASKFSSQMMCEPSQLSDGRFNTDDLVVYDDDVVYTESGQEPVLYIGGHKMVSAVAWWDPAFGKKGGDKSVIAIVYTGEDGRFWVHHVQALFSDPSSCLSEIVQQCRKVVELSKDYFLPIIAVEKNGIGQFLPGVLKKELADAEVACAVMEITSRRPKNLRIREAFEDVLAARSLNVHRTVIPNSFLHELQDWSPDKKKQADDTLDAVAGAMSMQPVRIKRNFFGGKKPTWMGSTKVRQAKTDFDV